VLYTEGISGNVSMDENGDRNADYSLLDMDPITGIFQVFYSSTFFVIIKTSSVPQQLSVNDITCLIMEIRNKFVI
jgi:hypothetical protein